MALLATVLTLNSYQLWGQCVNTPSVVNITNQAQWDLNFPGAGAVNLNGIFTIAGNITINLSANTSVIYDFFTNSKIVIGPSSNIVITSPSGSDHKFASTCNDNLFWKGFEVDPTSSLTLLGNIRISDAEAAIWSFPSSGTGQATKGEITCLGTTFLNNKRGIHVTESLFQKVYVSGCEFNWDIGMHEFTTLAPASKLNYIFLQHVVATNKFLTVYNSVFNNSIEPATNLDAWVHSIDKRGVGIMATNCEGVRVENRTFAAQLAESGSNETSSESCLYNDFNSGEENKFRGLSYGVNATTCGYTSIIKNTFDRVLKSISLLNTVTNSVIQLNTIDLNFPNKTGDFVLGGYGISAKQSKKFLIEKNTINCIFPSSAQEIYFHGIELNASNATEASMIRANNITLSGHAPRLYTSGTSNNLAPTNWIDRRYASGLEVIDNNVNVNIECNIIDISGVVDNGNIYYNNSGTFTGIYAGTVIGSNGPFTVTGAFLNLLEGNSSVSSGNEYKGLEYSITPPSGIGTAHNWTLHDADPANQTIIHWCNENRTAPFNATFGGSMILGAPTYISTTANDCNFDPCYNPYGGNSGSMMQVEPPNPLLPEIGQLAMPYSNLNQIKDQFGQYLYVTLGVSIQDIVRLQMFDMKNGSRIVHQLQIHNRNINEGWNKLEKNGSYRFIIVNKLGHEVKGILHIVE